jgi:hypothetical protein
MPWLDKYLNVVVSISSLCVYQLIPIYHECIKVRINVSAPQCLFQHHSAYFSAAVPISAPQCLFQRRSTYFSAAVSVSASQCLLLDFLGTLYTTKSKGFRTNPWAIPYFVVPSPRKILSFTG